MSRETFRLPDVGEGLTEADVLHWHVAVGDPVTVNQTLVEVETAKAAVELPCPFDGTVHELLAAEGDTVAVGSPLVAITTGEDEPAAPEGSGSVLVGYGTSASATRRRRRRPVTPEPARPGVGNGERQDGGAGPRATPPVRKMAKDAGVDLAAVAHDGERISRDDVRRHLERSEHPEPPGDTRERIAGVRKATAAAVTTSAFTAPHVTEFLTVDVTATVATVAALKEHPAFAGIRVTPLLLVARALLSAIRHHPEVHARWDEANQEIVRLRTVNLGIAAATERGLIVPNVPDAGSLTLPGLARSLEDLTTTARAGRTPPERMRGGTATITNVGVFGVDAATPILNPGESAILCVGAIRRRPWEYRGEVALREVTTLSLSFDHRLVDGELGSKVLARVGAVLGDPAGELLLD
ncbi:dihydrolipoamide acetyltransferase family protein [Actinomycetospora sp. NBRC 106378]|uniref:dihydrolipoamide acetyltransferase family protein n=1 Tax=Actinomycetospora sp. NBRC 106378 TaxID=3032208 RepID=UPI00249F95A1|nr:dihydrolipoamide acetyltransferase family protein [Actinomycetospora sp. NBRC 106378]GLZ53216.1 dihydrolipoamide acetyltransferase component of pyruvate dehydrogenase complex [Actinomycetospora sp. NBRC 106378]